MSRFFSILGLVVIAANAIYANLNADTDKRITLAVYLLGVIGAAIGKGYERLRVLQNHWAVIAGVIATAITALVSIDPTMLTFIPPGVKSTLVIVAGTIVTLGKSLIGWNEPPPPGWKNNALSAALMLSLLGALFSFTACGDAPTTKARKFINLLDRSSGQANVALRTTRTLVEQKLLSPERALTINEGLKRYNAANRVAFEYLQNSLTFDKDGKAVLQVKDGSKAQQLLDEVTRAASFLLSNQALGGIPQIAKYSGLVALLADVAKLALQLRSNIPAASIDLTIYLDRRTSQLLNQVSVESEAVR